MPLIIIRTLWPYTASLHVCLQAIKLLAHCLTASIRRARPLLPLATSLHVCLQAIQLLARSGYLYAAYRAPSDEVQEYVLWLGHTDILITLLLGRLSNQVSCSLFFSVLRHRQRVIEAPTTVYGCML